MKTYTKECLDKMAERVKNKPVRWENNGHIIGEIIESEITEEGLKIKCKLDGKKISQSGIELDDIYRFLESEGLIDKNNPLSVGGTIGLNINTHDEQ
jgi:hypothetical protein